MRRGGTRFVPHLWCLKIVGIEYPALMRWANLWRAYSACASEDAPLQGGNREKKKDAALKGWLYANIKQRKKEGRITPRLCFPRLARDRQDKKSRRYTGSKQQIPRDFMWDDNVGGVREGTSHTTFTGAVLS